MLSQSHNTDGMNVFSGSSQPFKIVDGGAVEKEWVFAKRAALYNELGHLLELN